MSGIERCHVCGAYRVWGDAVLPEGALVAPCPVCGDAPYLEHFPTDCGWEETPQTEERPA